MRDENYRGLARSRKVTNNSKENKKQKTFDTIIMPAPTPSKEF